MKKVVRPWGNFKEFVKNKKCTVKILEVKARQQLSLQYHEKREELWYVLEGGFVVLGKKKRKVREGDLIRVPKKIVHRLIAGTKRMLVLEIATGVFSESDIVRLEDSYGRG